MFKEIGAIDAHATHVRQPGATPFAIQLAHPPQETLDTDEVEFRMKPGVAGQEGGVAASQFHFQRLFRWKQRREMETFHYRRKLINQIGCRHTGGSSPFDSCGELSLSVWIQ